MSEPTCQWMRTVGCGLPESLHWRVNGAHEFTPPRRPPEPHEVVPALVVTSWTCHACGADNDVWGEGAVNGWMECACGAESWLSLDRGIAENAPG